MNKILSTLALSVGLLSPVAVLAASYPDGGITIVNRSNAPVTAQVSSIGSFTLAANEVRNVAYSTLARVCSSNPANCRAFFFINNRPAGSAAINTFTGKIVGMNSSAKVRTIKGPQNILRSVIIK